MKHLKTSSFFLLILLINISCSDELNDSFENKIFIDDWIGSTFVHKLENCSSTDNPEINCTEFIEFLNKDEVSLLIGGGDIVLKTACIISGNAISLAQNGGLTFPLSFLVQNDKTIKRVDNGDVWVKE